MKLRNPPRYGAFTMYRLLATAAGHGRLILGEWVKPPPTPEKYAFARDSPVWPELGPPFEVGGQWRAAYAHGHSVPLTDAERDELIARHQEKPHEPAEDSPAEPEEHP